MTAPRHCASQILSVVDVELVLDPPHVRGHGVTADTQLVGDVVVLHAAGDVLGHPDLLGGQFGGAHGVPRGSSWAARWVAIAVPARRDSSSVSRGRAVRTATAVTLLVISETLARP